MTHADADAHERRKDSIRQPVQFQMDDYDIQSIRKLFTKSVRDVMRFLCVSLTYVCFNGS